MKKILTLIICLIVIALCIFVSINFINNDKKEDKKVFNLQSNNSNRKKEVKGSSEENNSNIKNNVSSNSTVNSNIESNVVSNILSNSNVSNSTSTSKSNLTSSTTTEKNTSQNVINTSNVVSSNSIESSNIPSSVEDESGKVMINDTVGVWSQQEDLKIFDVDKVKPGDSGLYEFEVNNNTKETSKYKIIFDEINEYQANIMYKLKRNDEYVAGNADTWVKYDKLNLDTIIIEKNEKDSYQLEWKWVDAENDTQVGRHFDATYTLKLGIQTYEHEKIEKQVKGASENPMTLDNIKYYILLFIISIITIIVLAKSYRKNSI